MHVRQRDDKVEITFPFDMKLVAFVKSLDGRKYDARTKSWTIPLPRCGVSLGQLEKRGFVIDPALKEAVEADERNASEAVALATASDAEFDTKLPLFPYQRAGAAFLYRAGSALLGDEMGLGKTIQSLAVAEAAEAKKVLIFCPASVKEQWADEIAKFLYPDGAPKGEIIVVKGTRRMRDILLRDTITVRRESWNGKVTTGTRKHGARFFIVNYELLLWNFDAMDCREWDLIIADEATKVSNAEAKISKAIKRLRAKRRIPMTGTPISNKPDEIWNLIDFVAPGALGGYRQFLDRYSPKITYVEKATGETKSLFKRQNQNMTELKEKIQRYMIRRLQPDVLSELPEKIVTDVPFELTDEEKALYEKLKEEILFEIAEKDIAKVENPMTIQYTLVKMLRLQQLADSTELLGHNEKSSKLDVLKELLSEALEGNDRKAIVFTKFAKMADVLERELAGYGALKISGDIKEEYGDVVKKFNTDESKRILIMTSAGQFGLNIQRASVIFHYDFEWSLAKMRQRDGRAHRYGQKNSVLVYNLLAKGTVDYYIKKVVHDKAALAADLLGDPPILMGDIKGMLEQQL